MPRTCASGRKSIHLFFRIGKMGSKGLMLAMEVEFSDKTSRVLGLALGIALLRRHGELYSYFEHTIHRELETFGPDSTMPRFFLPHPLTEDVSCCNLWCFNLSRHPRSDLENSATPFASPWRPPDAKT